MKPYIHVTMMYKISSYSYKGQAHDQIPMLHAMRYGREIRRNIKIIHNILSLRNCYIQVWSRTIKCRTSGQEIVYKNVEQKCYIFVRFSDDLLIKTFI